MPRNQLYITTYEKLVTDYKNEIDSIIEFSGIQKTNTEDLYFKINSDKGGKAIDQFSKDEKDTIEDIIHAELECLGYN